MLKSVLTTVVISSFAGMALVGFFAMAHTMGHSHYGCLAAAAEATPCPEEATGLGFINFHFDAFKNFSRATFAEGLSTAVLFAIASIWVVASAFRQDTHPKFLAPQFYFRPTEFLAPLAFLRKQQLSRWLACHENSPAFY